MRNALLVIPPAAAAVAAPVLALAQAAGTGLQIYGLIEAMPMHQKFENGLPTATGASTDKSDAVLHSPASRLGFRGREALGDGLAVWFQAELGIQTGRPHVDEAANGENWLGGRNTGVGLDGSIGTVMFGTWDSPYKVAGLSSWNLGTFGLMSHYGIIMNNGDTTGTEPSTQPGNAVGVLVEGNTASFGRRLSGSVQYWSPDLAGLQARIATQLNGQKTIEGISPQNDPRLWSGSVVWSRGRISVGAAYERHEGFRDQGTLGAISNVKDDGWQIGAKYSLGRLAFGAGYERLDYGDTGGGTNFQLNNWVINGTLSIGAGELFAGYSQTDGFENCGAAVAATGACGAATEADMVSWGYAQNLSKRTKVYFSYSKIDNGRDGTVGSSYYWVSGPVGNQGGGAAAGVVPGTDVRAIGVGIQHAF